MSNYLRFDIRALALMRICVAFVLMLDLGIRLSDLEAFYSNTGVLPLPVMFEHAWNPYFISIHTISGLWQVELFLFLLAFIFAVFLFIGYRTKLFTFLSWFMLMSLHNRNIMILQGGDDLLRMVLFWAMFIPWGNAYSCDRLFSNLPAPDKKLITVATIGYFLQVCYIYTGSALLKGAEWNESYTALYYTYSLDQLAYPITKHIYYHPDLLKQLTCAAYYFELLVPLLFFIPVKHSWFRIAGVFAIITFHLLNSMTLFIGLFPVIGIATVTGILPAEFMDWFDRVMYRLKNIIRGSFKGIGSAINYMIRWKEPVEISSPAFQKIKMAALIFLIVFVFDWNFSNLSFVSSKLSDHLRFIGYGLRLDQNWGMFAPNVYKDDGWFILEGTTTDGKTIDLLHPDSPLTYNKPASVVSMFKNDRWRKYSENYIFADNMFLRGYFCNYCKRVWNEKHPERYIKSLRVIFMSEFSLPDYHYSLPQKNVLWECLE
jgi:hypothetical protein